MMRVFQKLGCSLVISLVVITMNVQASDDALTVNWYHGKEFMMPVAQAFTRATGIKVKVTNGDDSFDTDVMFVPDYASIHKAADAGKFANIKSVERDARVPSQWRGENGLWYGALVRLRGMVYNAEKVDGSKLTSIYDLADPAYKGRVCLLEGSYKSNRSLLAILIAQDGEEKAGAWAKAVKDNMAGEWDNDMDNISRIARGECDVALADNYYYHYMQEAKRTVKYKIPLEYIMEMPELTSAVSVKWIDQETHGNPANVTAVAVAPNTPRRDAALKFVDFILSDKGQEILSENLFKYPVVPGVEWPYRLKDQGRPRMSDLNLNTLRPHYETVDKIYREAGWK